MVPGHCDPVPNHSPASRNRIAAFLCFLFSSSSVAPLLVGWRGFPEDTVGGRGSKEEVKAVLAHAGSGMQKEREGRRIWVATFSATLAYAEPGYITTLLAQLPFNCRKLNLNLQTVPLYSMSSALDWSSFSLSVYHRDRLFNQTLRFYPEASLSKFLEVCPQQSSPKTVLPLSSCFFLGSPGLRVGILTAGLRVGIYLGALGTQESSRGCTDQCSTHHTPSMDDSMLGHQLKSQELAIEDPSVGVQYGPIG